MYSGDKYRIDMRMCMYFAQGHNKVYTHDLLQLYKVT
jgi:hypothetical protein